MLKRIRVVLGLELLPPLNKCACNDNDEWVVYRTDTYTIVETASYKGRAMKGIAILNEHERKNGREEVYAYAHAPLTTITV